MSAAEEYGADEEFGNEENNQTNEQPNNQTIERPTEQTIEHSIDQTNDQMNDQTNEPSTNQSNNQIDDQPSYETEQSNDQADDVDQSLAATIDQPYQTNYAESNDESNDQTNDQSNDQSNDPSNDQAKESYEDNETSEQPEPAYDQTNKQEDYYPDSQSEAASHRSEQSNDQSNYQLNDQSNDESADAPAQMSNSYSNSLPARDILALSSPFNNKSGKTTQRSSRVMNASPMNQANSQLVNQLQEWNDELQNRLNQAEAYCQSLAESKSQSEAQIQSANRLITELRTQASTAQQQYQSIKGNHAINLATIAKLEASNVDLLSQSVGEKNSRSELETRLNRCEVALRRERDENARLRGRVNESSINQRVEGTTFEHERAGFRSEISDLSNRIDHLNIQLKQTTLMNNQLQHSIQVANQEINQANNQNQELNNDLQRALKTASSASDEAREAQGRIKQLEDSVVTKGQFILELEAVIRTQKETIRTQADRISSVVFQLNRVDEWKIGAEAERAERDAQLIELRGVCEAQTKATQAANVARDRSDAMISILEDRLGKEAKRVQEGRDKAADLDRDYKTAMSQVRASQADFDHLSIKYGHMQQKFAQLSHTYENNQQSFEQLTHKYAASCDEIDSLRREMSRLEDEKFVANELLAERDTELSALKKKDELYSKIQSMLASSGQVEVSSMLAALTSHNEKYVRYTNPVTKGKLKVALATGAGHRVKDALRRCEVASRELLDWAIEPQRLIDGVDDLITRLANAKSHEQAFAKHATASHSATKSVVSNGSNGRDQPINAEEVAGLQQQIDLLVTKQAETAAALIKCEADKAKAIRRYVSSISMKSRHAPQLVQNDDEASNTFLTELEANNQSNSSVDRENLSTIYAALGVDSLSLADAGLYDAQIDAIVPIIAQSGSLIELDLRHNSIGNGSLIGLIEACLNPSNSVRSIDLQQNQITLDGLEDAAMAIVRYAHHGPANQNQSKHEEKQSHAPYVLSVRLMPEGASLQPVIELKLPHKSLVVDLRFNRLQHSERSFNASRGESVKQLMRRVLTRVTRAFNEVNQRNQSSVHSNSDMSAVDLDRREMWMTNEEVAALIERNAERKAREDAAREDKGKTFDTQVIHNNKPSKTSQLNSFAPVHQTKTSTKKDTKKKSTTSNKLEPTNQSNNQSVVLPRVRTPTSGRGDQPNKQSISSLSKSPRLSQRSSVSESEKPSEEEKSQDDSSFGQSMEEPLKQSAYDDGDEYAVDNYEDDTAEMADY